MQSAQASDRPFQIACPLAQQARNLHHELPKFLKSNRVNDLQESYYASFWHVGSEFVNIFELI